MAFKVKINVLLLLAILVTIGTAWFSVNHFISGYIRTQATQNINEQITLVREKLAGDINQKVLLAANLNLGVTSVKKALQETGFHNIVKLIGDMAFDANGVIDDKARVDALRKLIPAANNQITVSPLERCTRGKSTAASATGRSTKAGSPRNSGCHTGGLAKRWRRACSVCASWATAGKWLSRPEIGTCRGSNDGMPTGR